LRADSAALADRTIQSQTTLTAGDDMLSRHPSSKQRAGIRPVIFSLCGALLIAACDDAKDLTAPVPIVSGRVTNAATGRPVAGAEVRIGSAVDTTSASGRFDLTDLTPGASTFRATAIGFGDFETAITVTSGAAIQDVGLTRIEVFEFENFALYVPASVDVTRGVILALGGPDTRAFATGKPFGAPMASVEASLQALGQSLRALAATRGLAILGTSRAAMANGPASDTLLMSALATVTALSARPEIPSAHLIMYGLSGGAPQASGFTVRNPERVAGLFLKVPAGVSSVTDGAALRVPTYVVLAELDVFVNNTALTAAFASNRGARGLWALVKERGVPHHSLSPLQRQVTVNWISNIVDLRLPATPGSGSLLEIAESSGWLGNDVTGTTAPWATYSGDRASASWLPSQATATEWETFIASTGS
jgi:hypothetical protein